jgi:hypothetical protein
MWQKKEDPGKKGSRKDGDKRKFLDAHPAKQKGMPGQSGNATPDSVQFHAMQQSDQLSNVAQQVLVYHESETGASSGSDWMSRLKEESMNFLAEQRGVQLQQLYREAAYKKGVEVLVDKIYGLLQRYAFEFNQIAGGTDLHVSGTISGDVTEATKVNRMREIEETETFFRARFSTKLFSLVVRGKDDHIDFYLIPTTRMLAASLVESEYKPVSTLQVRITEQGMMWRMADAIPPVDSLDKLCMWLFTTLIEETKEATKEEDDDEQKKV